MIDDDHRTVGQPRSVRETSERTALFVLPGLHRVLRGAETAFEDGLVDLSHDFIRGTHTPYASPGAPLRVQIRSAFVHPQPTSRNRRGVATLHGQRVA